MRRIIAALLAVALVGCGGGGRSAVSDGSPRDLLVAHVGWLERPGATGEECGRLARGTRARVDRLGGLLRAGGRCATLERETAAQLLAPFGSGSRSPGALTAPARGGAATGRVAGWRAEVPLVRERDGWRVEAGGDRAVRWRLSQSLACAAYGRDSARAALPTASPGGWLLAAEAQEQRLAAYLRAARRARPPAVLRDAHRGLVGGLERALRAQRTVRRMVNDGVPPGTAQVVLARRLDRALRRVRGARRDGGVVCWTHPLHGTSYADRAQAACRRSDERLFAQFGALLRASSPAAAARALRRIGDGQRRLAQTLRGLPIDAGRASAAERRSWRRLHGVLVADLRASALSLRRLARLLATGNGSADPYRAGFRTARAEAAAARLGLDDCTTPTPISPTDGTPPRRGKQPGVADTTPV
ncbi:hypothetical protein [Patulibacter defluvii]|uniref:hypothetical protein n=1 Tax=Patulibacter defluvii TaxID=3095358 RepID=UPI002A74D558|nr:hypothetical protein [Patulibacter sp. DM4]